MPKVTDIKAYWKELAKKNGVDDDSLKPLLEAMDNENVRKALTEGFKPLPDYSHDLDEVRDRAKKEKDQEYADWFAKEQVKYNEYLKAEEMLKQYEARHGKLDGSGNPTGGLTKEEALKLMEEQLQSTLSRRDSAYMDLLEIRESHLGAFKKPLDVKTFEAAWKEHPEWGNSMKSAYKFFVEPDMEKIRETEFNDRLKARYDEGVRDGFSRRSLPVDSASKTFSPMFDRKEEVGKMSEREQDNHSRQAFFDGLREKNPS